MRRNDHDVTDEVRTTDLAAVRSAVLALYGDLYDRPSPRPIRHAFAEIDCLYRGEHPEYCACDTGYHDIQHVLDVSLAMTRLMHGYERSRSGAALLGAELFQLGVIAALFHDMGYLRRRADRRHRNGAEYTLVHVSRGARYLRRYLTRNGLGGAHEYVRRHFGGQNLYLEELHKNVRFAVRFADLSEAGPLRRRPPATLEPGIEPLAETAIPS